MKHVYDVTYEVYYRDPKRGGNWDTVEEMSIVANGDIRKATRKAERIALAEKPKPEKDEHGRVFCCRPYRVRVTQIARVREVRE
jgi:hypothetical protein